VLGAVRVATSPAHAFIAAEGQAGTDETLLDTMSSARVALHAGCQSADSCIAEKLPP